MVISGIMMLNEYVQSNAQALKPLNNWIQKVQAANWRSHADVIATFGPSAVYLKDSRYKFKIGGNKYRLITIVSFIGESVIIRFVGTHAEYDKINASKI